MPKIIKKHTHVETKYVHIFHPTKVLPQGLVLRSDPTVFPTGAMNMDLLRMNPKLYAQMMSTKLFYQKLRQKEKSNRFLNDIYSAQPSDLQPVTYNFPLDRQLDTNKPQLVDHIYFTTVAPVNLPPEISPTDEQPHVLKRHPSDANIKMISLRPDKFKRRMFNKYPKKFKKSNMFRPKGPFIIKVN